MSVNAMFGALSGLSAHRRVLDTTAHNITNQLTPGYRRQVVDLAPIGIGTGASLFTGQNARATGVEIDDVRRVVDDLAEVRARETVATAVDAGSQYASMVQLENVFGEPGETGIATRFDQFWVSWSDLADRADDPVERGEVVSNAQDIAGRFRQASSDLDEINTDTLRRMDTMADEINTIAAQVADLNRSIASSPSTPNHLLDERDMLAGKLASLAGADVKPTDRGMVALAVGGRLLVGDGVSYPIEFDGSDVVWQPDGTPLEGRPSELTALQRLRNETLPGVRGDLDAIVESFVTEVNDLHRAGYGLDGVSGRDFFDPTGVTAASIAVADDMVADPDLLAAGAPVLPGPTAPGVFDGRQAQLIGDLAVNGAATGDYRTFVADLGIRTNSAERRADTAQAIANRSVDEAESVSGVSLDEEMATMMAAQRAYEASARVLSTVDQMLETILSIVR